MAINMSNHPHASYTDVWYAYNHESLHDVVVALEALEAHHTKYYHFSIGEILLIKQYLLQSTKTKNTASLKTLPSL